jgi:hypothetical protein
MRTMKDRDMGLSRVVITTMMTTTTMKRKRMRRAVPSMMKVHLRATLAIVVPLSPQLSICTIMV